MSSSEAMYGYADLPTLVPVMDKILGYLSVKERVRCKGVCRAWREEIELRESKSDTLILHQGPYPWNLRWRQTNNRGLMKYENSFEMKRLTFLAHPLTRALLAKTKKLAILHYGKLNRTSERPDLQPYLEHFTQCSEIEIKHYLLMGALTFDLPKLRVLVVEWQVDKLVLNCPSLEVLFWNFPIPEIDFRNAKKLKRLFSFGWPKTVSLAGQLENVEYLNLYAVNDKPVDDRLLERMPNLKRLVLYSNKLQADLKIIREQQNRFGLADLEVLPFGFCDPVEIEISHDANGYVRIDAKRSIEQLFENYSKLVENSPWRVWIDYSKLFAKFKMLPSNFIERFNEPYSIDIREVTNYTHLYEFLKCYPSIQQIGITFSKVNADRVLDLVHLLKPTLTELAIWEERPNDVLEIDLSFLRLFQTLTGLYLKSTRLPAQFIRRVATKRGALFQVLVFGDISSGHRLMVSFSAHGLNLIDLSCGTSIILFSVEELIVFMKNDRHLSKFLLL